MEKVFKIVIVFGLLMLAIVYSMRMRDRRFREYYFDKRVDGPMGDDMRVIVIDREAPVAAKDMELQLLFVPGERSVRVIEDLTGRPLLVIRLERDPHALLFDAEERLLYAVSGDGVMTVLRQVEAAVYKPMQSFSIPADVALMGVRPGELWFQTGEGIQVYTNV